MVQRARTAADDILAAAEAEAAKLRTESAALRVEVEAAANEAERRKQQAIDERGRVTALLDEEVEAGRRSVRLSQERAAQLTEEADALLARARGEADELLAAARENAQALEAEKTRVAAERKEVQESAAGITADAVARGRAEAEQYLAAARKEAAGIVSQAEGTAQSLACAAQAEAKVATEEVRRAREKLSEQDATKARRDKQIDEWSPRVALSAVVGLTASGEFQLAQLAGWPPVIAWLLPLGIDVYVVQALRRHRDVSAALILMVAANAIYHLAAAGLFGVRGGRPEWWLLVGVAAIAPFVMWRLHKIVRPRRERRRKTDHAVVSHGTAEALSVKRVETKRVETGMEVSTAPALEPGETSNETSGETTNRRRETARRETKKKVQRRRETKPRETRSKKVSPIGDIDSEISQLVALMQERGGTLTVSLDDAIETTGRSKATAARRLETARNRYRETQTA
ncbi:hypothetical protein FHS39_002569 [Streptomyces olivoverticillatus]|uniref:Uncharacterized protein n=1 Tax=Streptomyces olivoverticillatus TaxID=66427 RepID=A0A7W7PLL7_9ACTN|nr:ATP synthase F0 subunit B [Streptomyces olivoverticillatus]MBB4893538.1 hypothetical protein [Streptomyces olivoverticillatus]